MDSSARSPSHLTRGLGRHFHPGGGLDPSHSARSPTRPTSCPAFRGVRWEGGAGLDLGKARCENNDDLSVERDDPSFPAAINAALVVINGAHSLVWSRSNGPKED